MSKKKIKLISVTDIEYDEETDKDKMVQSLKDEEPVKVIKTEEDI